MFTGLLRSRNRTYRVRRTDVANLCDLRDGPVVLIGGVNNHWTRQVTKSLRYTFATDGTGSYIRDNQNSQARYWVSKSNIPAGQQTQDFALISRVFDPLTGRVVVSAGGILRFGTMAAGEFLTQSRYMEAAAKLAPGDSKHKNVQVVIGTSVVGEDAGPPHVLAAATW
jgi:hypothetical protein